MLSRCNIAQVRAAANSWTTPVVRVDPINGTIIIMIMTGNKLDREGWWEKQHCGSTRCWLEEHERASKIFLFSAKTGWVPFVITQQSKAHDVSLKGAAYP